ncbi:MAG: 3-keto-steroid reductase [Claussenomyces sp. TS43310]|nr:MAG: 3-keto-steroid reductase [Claussenomyces sp. TS43310]
MGLPPWAGSSSQWFVLITGSNSGLGYSICERTIDEFLSSPSHAPTLHLVLIVSTRSAQKTRLTVARLRRHLRHLAERLSTAQALRMKASPQGTTYRWQDFVARVHFLGVELDLCDLRQVYDAAARIRGENGGLSGPEALATEGMGLKNIHIPRLDVLVLNAGIGGWTGIRWGPAIWSVLTDLKETVTWWNYNVSAVGKLAKLQARSQRSGQHPQKLINADETEADGGDEPPLGEVFAANVFGHYILAHELMPLLRDSVDDERRQGDKGRVIWMSSIEALGHDLDPDDIQGIRSPEPYRASKRLTDILALTVDLPGVRRASASWFTGHGPSEVQADEGKPRVYLAHPGITNTEIFPLALILLWAKLAAMYVARWIGSVWHPIDSYKAAVAPTWLVLADQRTLDGLEGVGAAAADGNGAPADKGKGKWGSSTNFWGEERVRRTEVPGWGWCGEVDVQGGGGQMTRGGRKRGATDLTPEERVEFEVTGRRVWEEMEALRRRWEGILKI